jgi:hypothetical protein
VKRDNTVWAGERRFYAPARFPSTAKVWHDASAWGVGSADRASRKTTWGHPFLKEESTMKWRNAILILFVSSLAGMAGCGGDMVKQMMTNAETKAKVMDAIVADPATAGEMVDRLIGTEATRGVVMERLMANGEMVQGIMGRIARDQTMVDGVLNMAVQDSIMREHVVTLFKGMQMSRGGR